MNSFDAAAMAVMLVSVLVHEQHRICRCLPDGRLHTEHTHQHVCRHNILPHKMSCSAVLRLYHTIWVCTSLHPYYTRRRI